jgi:hypothetical protein
MMKKHRHLEKRYFLNLYEDLKKESLDILSKEVGSKMEEYLFRWRNLDKISAGYSFIDEIFHEET